MIQYKNKVSDMQHAQLQKLLQCQTEHVRPTKMRLLKGRVPPNLKGTYIKVGPTFNTKHNGHHALDGQGYVVKVAFPGDGKTPLHQGRFINTRCHQHSLPGNAFGGPLLVADGGIRNPANTNITYWNGKLLAWFDAGAPVQLEPTTLSTIQTPRQSSLNFQRGVPLTTGSEAIDAILRSASVIGDCVNAHPKVDTHNNLVCMELKYALAPRPRTKVVFQTIASAATTATTSSSSAIWLDGVAYLHDFVLTDRHIIFVHHPLSFNTPPQTGNLIKWWNTTGIVNALKHDTTRCSVLYVIDRKTGAVKHIPVLSLGDFFISHHIQAHYAITDPNMIHITSIVYPSYMELPGRVVTFEIDLKKDTVTTPSSLKRWMEFPVSAARDWYATCSIDGSHPMQSLCYVKNNTVHHMPHKFQKERWWGEPAVSNRRHVLAFAQEINSGHTTLNIFDATLQDHICELDFGPTTTNVPIGLHGTFVPNALL
jgi:all-trans-8'-apo-beta-carotenal 15,15'-oxygenase